MGIPEGSFAVAAFVVFALPGLIYAAVRRWSRGEQSEDRDFGMSVARGVIYSLALSGVYLLLFGEHLFTGLKGGADADTIAFADVRMVAWVILVLYIVVPGVIAVILNSRHIVWEPVGKLSWIRFPRSRYGYSSTPSAWDHAARRNQNAWVKIRRADGKWVGGWVTKGSFVTTYPEKPSIYIDKQFAMKDDGNFGPEVAATGVFITIGDGDIVVWAKTDKPE